LRRVNDAERRNDVVASESGMSDAEAVDI